MSGRSRPVACKPPLGIRHTSISNRQDGAHAADNGRGQLVSLDILHHIDEMRESVVGTFETCRRALRMSVDWGRPEGGRPTVKVMRLTLSGHDEGSIAPV